MTSTPPQETTTTDIIEHIVLFNVKEINNEQEDYHTKVNDMVNDLNALNSLPSVIYLTAGPILRTRSKSSSLKFTHMLHARYHTISDLYNYSVHPQHVSVVDNLVRPLCDDVMAVDWSATLGDEDTNLVPRPGSAMRITFLEVEGEKEEEEFYSGIREIKEEIGAYAQISYGKNFSERGKGYSVATLVVFSDLNELDASEEYEDQMRSLVNKFKHNGNTTIAVDYVVPRLATVNSTTE